MDWNLEKLDEKFRTLRNVLFKRRDYIFKFLKDPLVLLQQIILPNLDSGN